MKAVFGLIRFVADLAIGISPAIVGAVWLYAGWAMGQGLGSLGLAAWTIPTLTASLFLAWSHNRSIKSSIEMQGLSQEEVVARYSQGDIPFVPSLMVGMFAVTSMARLNRHWFLRFLALLSMGILAVEGSIAILASWMTTGFIVGSGLGVPGMIVGAMLPMLLFFYWAFEADKLRKLHPECVGGS